MTAGLQPYVLPLHLLADTTSRGPLWDPALNLQSFTYDATADDVRASTRSPRAPTAWFRFAGRWGDRKYALGDPRQYRFAGEYHYADGPTGPRFKQLARAGVCEKQGVECEIRGTVA